MSVRLKIENAIDALFDLLDIIDGDADLEPDPPELDPAEDGIADRAALDFVLAERARRSGRGRIRSPGGGSFSAPHGAQDQ